MLQVGAIKGEEGGVGIMPSGNDALAGDPKQVAVREGTALEGGVDGALGLGTSGHGDGGIVADKGQGLSIGGEGDIMDPTTGREFTKDITKGELGTPRGGFRLVIDSLDVTGEDTGLEVGGTAGDEDIVGVPINGEDGGADGLLDVLADPPIIILLKVTDGDALGTAGHGELITLGAPFNLGGGPVDTQDNQGWLPTLNGLLLAIIFNGLLGPGPDIGIPILGAGDNAIIDGIPINASDQFVMFIQGGSLGPGVSALLVDVDLVAVGA